MATTTAVLAGIVLLAWYLPEKHQPVVGASVAAVSSGTPAPKSQVTAKRETEPAVKALHIDVCYFNALSLRAARDAYVDSLQGAEPNITRIPSFTAERVNGPNNAPAAPENQSTVGTGLAQAMPSPAPSSSVPFVARLRSCEIAGATRSPEFPDLDPALAEFDRYVRPLAHWLKATDAYYARGDYRRDRFRRGLTLHRALMPAFGELDGQLERFQRAFSTWAYPSGQLGALDRETLVQARSLARELFSGEHRPDPQRWHRLKNARELTRPWPEWEAFVERVNEAANQTEPLAARDYLAVSARLTELIVAVGDL